MHNYMKPLLERVEKGQIDRTYIISHRITLDEAPEMYKVWRDKKDNVTKIVIDPWAEKPPTESHEWRSSRTAKAVESDPPFGGNLRRL